MSGKKDIDKNDLEFLKDLFGGTKAESELKPTKERKIRKKPEEQCQYCGEMFISVGRHLPYCERNPENVQEVEPIKIPSRTAKRKVIIEEEVGPDWMPVISELVPLLKNLSSYVKKLNEEPIKVQLVK